MNLNGTPDRGVTLRDVWAGDVSVHLSPNPADVEAALQQLALVSIEATQGFPRAEEEIKTFASKDDEEDDGAEAEAETQHQRRLRRLQRAGAINSGDEEIHHMLLNGDVDGAAADSGAGI